MSIPLQDQVINALNAMYSPNSTQELIANANIYLEEFQRQMEAWPIADRLLRDSTQRLEIKNDLSSLSITDRMALRDSLVSNVTNYKTGPRNIATQLCLALASLTLQLKEWNDAVPSLINSWGTDFSTCNVLLEYLTVLPQEVNSIASFKTLSDAEYREQSNNILTKNSSKVLLLLSQLIKSTGNDVTIQERLFNCLLSWLKSGDIVAVDLKDSHLLDFAFEALISQPSLFDVSVEVVCGIIYETHDMDTPKEIIDIMVNKLNHLRAYLSSKEHDEDTLQGLCRVFTEAGEAYLDLIVKNPQFFKQILEGIVESIHRCPIRALTITFNFWYSFAQYIVTREDNIDREPFLPIFEATVRTIVGRLRFPLDDEEWTHEDMDSFRDFRHEIVYILKDCANVLGGNRALSICHSMLVDYMRRYEAKEALTWQELEAIMFGLRGMGSEIKPEEEEMLLNILSLLPKLPASVKVRYTATLVLARYAEWTYHRPNLLPFQLEYINQGFEFEEVVPASARAISDLGEFCGEHMVQYLPALFQLYDMYNGKLDKRDLIDISSGIAFTLSNAPPESFSTYFAQYTNPLASRIQALSQNEKLGSSEFEELDFCYERLSQLYRFGLPRYDANINHPALPTLEHLFELSTQLINRFPNHSSLPEAICTFIRSVLDSMAPDHLPYLPDLVQTMLRSFQATAFGCYLGVIHQTVLAFANIHPEPIFKLVEEVFVVMFGVASNHQSLDHIAEAVGIFAEMTNDAQNLDIIRLFRLTHLPTLLQFLAAAIDMHDRRAQISVLDCLAGFLTCLLTECDHGPSNPHLPLLNNIIDLVQQNNQLFHKKLVLNLVTRYANEAIDQASVILTLLAEISQGTTVDLVVHEFINLPNYPFATINKENNNDLVPSPALLSMGERLRKSSNQRDFRSFKKTVLHFVKGYLRQLEDEENHKKETTRY